MVQNPTIRAFWHNFYGVFGIEERFRGLFGPDSSPRRRFGARLTDPGYFGLFLGEIGRKKTKKVWALTVIVRTFLRYYSMSDIFGLAYLVGQIED
jgi:hypothetical protein